MNFMTQVTLNRWVGELKNAIHQHCIGDLGAQSIEREDRIDAGKDAEGGLHEF